MITFFIPDLIAAKVFSLTPPIGQTLPVRVTSPVIANESGTLTPVSKETILVTIAIPAEGPSLGTAPAGKWTCILLSVSFSLEIPHKLAFCFITEIPILADSCIVSPSLPVKILGPFSFIRADSNFKISPP